MKYAMFSTMPSTGTFTLSNIMMPLRTSVSESWCGVDMITDASIWMDCEMVSWISPVPGGMSMIR